MCLPVSLPSCISATIAALICLIIISVAWCSDCFLFPPHKLFYRRASSGPFERCVTLATSSGPCPPRVCLSARLRFSHLFSCLWMGAHNRFCILPEQFDTFCLLYFLPPYPFKVVPVYIFGGSRYARDKISFRSVHCPWALPRHVDPCFQAIKFTQTPSCLFFIRRHSSLHLCRKSC